MASAAAAEPDDVDSRAGRLVSILVDVFDESDEELFKKIVYDILLDDLWPDGGDHDMVESELGRTLVGFLVEAYGEGDRTIFRRIVRGILHTTRSELASAPVQNLMEGAAAGTQTDVNEDEA